MCRNNCNFWPFFRLPEQEQNTCRAHLSRNFPFLIFTFLCWDFFPDNLIFWSTILSVSYFFSDLIARSIIWRSFLRQKLLLIAEWLWIAQQFHLTLTGNRLPIIGIDLIKFSGGIPQLNSRRSKVLEALPSGCKQSGDLAENTGARTLFGPPPTLYLSSSVGIWSCKNPKGRI